MSPYDEWLLLGWLINGLEFPQTPGYSDAFPETLDTQYLFSSSVRTKYATLLIRLAETRTNGVYK